MGVSVTYHRRWEKYENRKLSPEKSYFFYSLLKIKLCLHICLFIEMPHLPPKILPIDLLITHCFGRFC